MRLACLIISLLLFLSHFSYATNEAISTIESSTLQKIVAEKYSYISDEIPVSMFSGRIYNDLMSDYGETAAWVNYNPTDDTAYLYYKGFMGTASFGFDRYQRVAFSDMITKYENWALKAINKKVTLEKTIGTITPTRAYFEMTNDWYLCTPPVMTIKFLSQNTDKHQLLIISEKLKSIRNDYLDFDPRILYLEGKEAQVLRESLSDEALIKAMETRSKKKDLESEFN